MERVISQTQTYSNCETVEDKPVNFHDLCRPRAAADFFFAQLRLVTRSQKRVPTHGESTEAEKGPLKTKRKHDNKQETYTTFRRPRQTYSVGSKQDGAQK